MTPDLSAIVVSHASTAEAASCVASLRQEFTREGIRGEIVLVDCGSDEEQRALLEGIPADRRILLAENRGYSGGANAGLAAARGGKVLLCNADVIFRPGAIIALADALDAQAVGVAAPLCFWDHEGRLLLPPGFAPSFFRDLGQIRGCSRSRLADRRFAAFARETLHLWRDGGRAAHLSGAVLAARRSVFDRVGRFDERFPFEYEETEWEERVLAAGLELRFVPQAKARHLWGASSSRNPGTAARKRESQRLYRDRHYGRGGRFLLERASRRLPRSAVRVEGGALPSFPPRAGSFLAVSPNPSRLPFAGANLEAGFSFAQEIADRVRGRWYFTVFRCEDGRPLETFAWEKG